VTGPFALGDEEAGTDPAEQFGRWFDDARSVMEVAADMMILATATSDGRPSARAVLLRGWDERGLVFFTDTRSRKGLELAANPRGAVVLVWPPRERQVRAEGPVEPVAADEADAYFAGRPRGHRLSAWASHQSTSVAAREELDARMARLDAEHGEEVPRPPWWGGYRLIPAEWEFWQGRPNRVHDRVRYRPADDGGWARDRLAP
jgi:pyridoxamine 5'-phosphate oxidase